ncbi:unnamed protein product [Rotaria socialis]|uniref:Uncharacterized protein n=2 Tax=Rotaria socialis TaxID=392032 RepID=A0A817Y8N5_9BILA|nr:unnamed protein product [Rotaria socialis]
MGCKSSTLITLERLPPASKCRENRRKQQLIPSKYKQMANRLKSQPGLNASLVDDDNDIHDVPCDECKSQYIIGDRYRCLECTDFDLCGTCFEKRRETDEHKNGHAFAHFRIPTELFGTPITDDSREVTLPQLIEKFKSIRHEKIACDGCKTNPIIGIRFKCDTCSSYDLCLKCKTAKVETNQHKSNHPLVVIGENNLQEIDIDDIKLGQKLGEGAFGAVYKAKWISRNRDVACKIISIQPTQMHLFQSFKRELAAYNELSGAYILKLYGYALRQAKSVTDEMQCALIMEFMSRGSLASVIREHEKLSLSCKLDMAWHIASGMRKLHDRKMIHRDIRPDNVLVNGYYTAKIGDMGIARDFRSPGQYMTTVGCQPYMPPEFYTSNYDQSLDVFTFGLTLYYLFNEKNHLFHEPSRKIILPEKSPVFDELIRYCTLDDQNQRPSALELETTFVTYKRVFEKHIRVQHQDYEEQSVEVQNRIFQEFYDSFSPKASAALKEKFPRASSRAQVIIDPDGVKQLLLMLLQVATKDE